MTSDDTKRTRHGPVLIDLQDRGGEVDPAPSPADAPPVPDPGFAPDPRMIALAQAAARPPSRLRRWFLGLGATLVATLVGIAVWEVIAGLIAQSTLLGGALATLFGLVMLLGLGLVLREFAALSRLAQLDKVRRTAEAVRARDDLAAARRLAGRLGGFYGDRPELADARAALARDIDEAFDADAVLVRAERRLMPALDAEAIREIELAARQVATVTALVPLALADLLTALFANLRMIRRISEIYGGRAGTLGAWRLIRQVLAHLVATGALALGDDMITSVAGGGLMSRLSRRFGEGVVNGALTARVGVAALEICRPLPFQAVSRPSVGGIVKRALAGLFSAGNTGREAGGAAERGPPA